MQWHHHDNPRSMLIIRKKQESCILKSAGEKSTKICLTPHHKSGELGQIMSLGLLLNQVRLHFSKETYCLVTQELWILISLGLICIRLQTFPAVSLRTDFCPALKELLKKFHWDYLYARQINSFFVVVVVGGYSMHPSVLNQIMLLCESSANVIEKISYRQHFLMMCLDSDSVWIVLFPRSE